MSARFECSSTFRDAAAERDVLVKHVPALPSVLHRVVGAQLRETLTIAEAIGLSPLDEEIRSVLS